MLEAMEEEVRVSASMNELSRVTMCESQEVVTGRR